MNLEEWWDKYTNFVHLDQSIYDLHRATLQSIKEAKIEMLEVMGCRTNGHDDFARCTNYYFCKRCQKLKQLKDNNQERDKNEKDI